MGLLGLLKEKVEVTVAVAKETYLPGETVEAAISITPNFDAEIDGARAELVYVNTFEYRTTSSTGKAPRTRTVEDTDRRVLDTHELHEAGTLAKEKREDYRVALKLPDDAIATAGGEITRVDWSVQATVARRNRPDPDGSAEITVLSSPERRADRSALPPEVGEPDDCGMEFRLRGRDLRPGDAVAGSLVVTPRESLESEELRVELVRKEVVPQYSGNTRERVVDRAVVAEAQELMAGMPVELPFHLTLPADAPPCLKTYASELHWLLRGVVSRRLRSDYNLVEELNVYTAPATQA